MLDFFKQNTKYIVIIIVVTFGISFLAGYEYKAYEIRSAFFDAFSDISDTRNGFIAGEPTENNNLTYIGYNIGDTIEYSTQTMKVNSAKSAVVLNQEYSEPLIADAGTKYIIVNHTVKNITDTSFMYEEFVLFDSDNRQYKADSDAIYYANDVIQYVDLASDVPETGDVIYKVPKGTTNFRFGGLKGSTTEVHVVDFSVQ